MPTAHSSRCAPQATPTPRAPAAGSRGWLLWLSVLVAAALAAGLPATKLPEHYHAFADQRSWAGWPHAANVWSNLPFALAGFGLAHAAARWQPRAPRHDAAASTDPHILAGLLVLTAFGLMLTALCSGLYHAHPHDAGLCLDRLGMSVAFAGMLGLAVADRVRPLAGGVMAALMLLAAPAAACWAWLDSNQTPWAVLQGCGLLLLISLSCPRPDARLGVSWWAVVLLYVLAKGLEVADHAIWQVTAGNLSGHTLKHLVSAMAVVPMLVAVRRQRSQPAPPSASAERAGHAQCTS